MVLRIIEREPRIGAGHSIECSTLENANWKSEDKAVQSAFIVPKEEANNIKIWSKLTSFTCHDPSNNSENRRGLEGTSHESHIEKRAKRFYKPKAQVASRAVGTKKPRKATEEVKMHQTTLGIPSAPFEQTR